MRGIVWDDLDKGSMLHAQTRQYYFRLIDAFRQDDVVLESRQDPDQFMAEFQHQRFDFVIIDLFDETGEKVGIGYAEKVRTFARESDLYKDPDFPIFLISRDLSKGTLKDLRDLRLHPIEKDLMPSLVVHVVKSALRPEGRWFAGSNSFIIVRMAEKSYSGEAFDDRNLALMLDLCREAGLTPNLLELGEQLHADLLDRITNKILTSQKIVTLITRDERLATGADPAFMCRPNVYLELGLVAARTSTLRRTLLLVQKGVAFPSDFGGRLQLYFNDSIEEIRDNILSFLRNPA